MHYSVYILILVFILAIGPLSIVVTNIYGTSQIVTVSFHKTLPGAKGVSPSITSCGYYYVNGKRYTFVSPQNVPIGTKIEIKYLPLLPGNNEEIRIVSE
jgi:hypothetical protein